MNKRGISTIVATVLVILITVAGVAIIWVGVLPIISESFYFSELEGRVSVVSSSGYTVYDAEREIGMVQVKRDVDEGVMDRIKVSFLIGGDSVSSSVIAPPSGGTKVYNFDLSGYGEPDGVEVSPIFVSGSGREKVGSVTSKVDIGSGRISSVDGVVYEMGVDSFGEIPTDGLVSIWTFSGDADDGVGGNDGSLENGASIVGGVLSLDGVDDYVDVGNTPSLDVTMEDFSVSVWAKVSKVDSGIFSKGSAVGQGYIFYLNSGWRARAYTLTSSGWRECTGVSTSSSDGEWHHIVFTKTAGVFSIYVDGVFDNSCNSYITDVLGSSGYSVMSGRVDGISWWFGGSLDNVMFYKKKALSEEEVSNIYEAQKKS